MKSKYIYETAVFDGTNKNWRILNLNSGSLYSGTFDTETQALASIEHGVNRNGAVVKRVTMIEIRESIQ